MKSPALLLAVGFVAGLAMSSTIARSGEGPTVAGPGAAVVSIDHFDDSLWRWAPSGVARVQPLAQGDNAYLGAIELEPGASIAPHKDSTEEYLVFTRGGGRITVDGVTTEVSSGTVVYMKAGAEVSFANGPRRTGAFQVFAGPEPAKKYDGWAPVIDGVHPLLGAGPGEAIPNLNGVQTAQKAYHAAFGSYLEVPACPAAPSVTRQPFAGSCLQAWETLGWVPDGDVRCSYRVELKGEGFTAKAECDVDGDGVRAGYVATDAAKAARMTIEGVR